MIKKILMAVLLLHISTQADSIVGVWELDKDRAKISIGKTISNKDQATLIQMLVTKSWQELEFQKDGNFKLLAAPESVPDYVWQKTSSNLYAIKMRDNKKMMAKEIVLSGNDTLLWKNMMEVDNLTLYYTRIGSSKVKAERKKNKSDLQSMLHLDKVYRTKIQETENLGNVYYYIAFGKDKSYVTITSKTGNLDMTSIEDMNSLIDAKEQHDKEIDNSSLDLMDKLDKKSKNPIGGFLKSRFSVKNQKLISSYGFSDKMEMHKEAGAVGLRRASVCKEITAISKEHLKCNNETEYFLYGQAIGTSTVSSTKHNIVNIDIEKEERDAKKAADIAFIEAIKSVE